MADIQEGECLISTLARNMAHFHGMATVQTSGSRLKSFILDQKDFCAEISDSVFLSSYRKSEDRLGPMHGSYQARKFGPSCPWSYRNWVPPRQGDRVDLFEVP
jgi:hypothetical protein